MAKKKVNYIKKVKKKSWRTNYNYTNERQKEWVVWGNEKEEFIIVDGFIWRRTRWHPVFRSSVDYLNRYLWEKTYKVKLTPKQRIGFKDGDNTNYQIGNLYDASKEEWRDISRLWKSRKTQKLYNRRKKAERDALKNRTAKQIVRDELKEIKKHWGKLPPIDDEEVRRDEIAYRQSLSKKTANAIRLRIAEEERQRTVEELIANFDKVMEESAEKPTRKKKKIG